VWETGTTCAGFWGPWHLLIDMRPTRRQLLATAGTAALAGCLGGSRTTERPGGGTESPSDTAGADVTRLRSLDVGPSPGSRVPVREPGTVSLVDFFATWCAPCKPQMDVLDAVRSSHAADRLHMVSVTSETDEAAVREFWREYDGGWPVLLDPELTATQAYEVKGIPTLVLLDGDGEVTWRHRGLAGEDTLQEKVGEALEG
jgi:thiol-disulfide isomerase/thioredoxin